MAEPTPSAPSPRQVAESLYAALLRSDREALAAIASPDIRIHVTEDLAYGGDYSGLPGFDAFVEDRPITAAIQGTAGQD
ncbi:hypothetical protein ABZT16_19500 [Streptomyces flaveolus]|uniref:hypothetical protein n=1 Tax=Streptomyces flaveolus TaxID=67297 RepID=UPI00069EDBA1|nr:hypothetical protein [Streptomyces antibioticus]